MVLLLNGSINAGKTTVAKELCRLLPRTAHVEVDDLNAFIDWMPLEETAQSILEQIRQRETGA